MITETGIRTLTFQSILSQRQPLRRRRLLCQMCLKFIQYNTSGQVWYVYSAKWTIVASLLFFTPLVTDIVHRRCRCPEARTAPRCFFESSRDNGMLHQARTRMLSWSRGGLLQANTKGTIQHRGQTTSSARFAHLFCACFKAKSPPSDSAIFQHRATRI